MRCAKASHASGRYRDDVTSTVGLILAEHLIHGGTFSWFRHQKLNFSCLSLGLFNVMLLLLKRTNPFSNILLCEKLNANLLTKLNSQTVANICINYRRRNFRLHLFWALGGFRCYSKWFTNPSFSVKFHSWSYQQKCPSPLFTTISGSFWPVSLNYLPPLSKHLPSEGHRCFFLSFIMSKAKKKKKNSQTLKLKQRTHKIHTKFQTWCKNSCTEHSVCGKIKCNSHQIWDVLHEK